MRFSFIIVLLFLLNTINAQDSNWKKAAKQADELYSLGQFEEAAIQYTAAWNAKRSKGAPFINKAGQCFMKLRNYAKAAEAFKNLKDDVENFPLASLNYAKCLKQMEHYDQAVTALNTLKENYTGPDKDKMINIIDNEMKGCELALTSVKEDKIVLEHLGENINTVQNEFAPLPFTDDILYFSSTMADHSKIYRSQQKSGTWTKAVQPNFPNFEDGHVCHGTFTPDNKRFYFTICNDNVFNSITSPCDLYVTVRKESTWSNPKKLRDYVKLEGTTATHPFVIHKGDTEILYFSSDRKGTIGGLDIWYMTREINSSDYDFTLPKNAGLSINTSGDEITPYYNEQEKAIYFSSNGHPNIGGFDIFKASGSLQDWASIEHLNMPYNSNADDYYFTPNKSKTGAFLVSNRLFGLQKINAGDDDLFFATTPLEEVLVSGNIYDKGNNSLINDVQIILYEMKKNGEKRLLHSMISSNGTYEFNLIPERQFRIEAIKDGFEMGYYNFSTQAFTEDRSYGAPIYMENTDSYVSREDEPVFKENDSTASVNKVIGSSNKQISNPPITPEPGIAPDPVISTIEALAPIYVNSYYQGHEVTTNAPKRSGTYYKIQISTVESFNSDDPQFDAVRGMGQFQTELIDAKGWVRILLSEYYSKNEALKMALKARTLGFPEAFMVKYRDGKRL